MLAFDDKISETLLITLYMKYLASRLPEPILHDASALALVPQIDYDFSKFDLAKGSLYGTALRTRYFDRLTEYFIRRTPDAVIVVPGCGLDDRLGRIGAAAQSVPFVQIDLPEVVALRRQWLPPKDNEILIEDSVFENGWRQMLQTRFPDARFLFVAEGLLMYFQREQVRALLSDWAHRFRGSEAAFDVCSSFAVRNSHRHDTVKYTQARFTYGCDDDREAESWADNLHLLEVKTYPDFPEFKNTGWIYWAMRFLPFMKKAFRILHYRID